jgi:putative transposase
LSPAASVLNEKLTGAAGTEVEGVRKRLVGIGHYGVLHCDVRAPQKVQWLTDNGSIFAAGRTLEIAVALNLEPCFTPVESPESNGMAEAFVKTFKRDYVRVNPLPDARTALSRIDHWMEDYNSEHPHSRLGYRSPREYIASLQPAACPV